MNTSTSYTYDSGGSPSRFPPSPCPHSLCPCLLLLPRLGWPRCRPTTRGHQHGKEYSAEGQWELERSCLLVGRKKVVERTCPKGKSDSWPPLELLLLPLLLLRSLASLSTQRAISCAIHSPCALKAFSSPRADLMPGCQVTAAGMNCPTASVSRTTSPATPQGAKLCAGPGGQAAARPHRSWWYLGYGFRCRGVGRESEGEESCRSLIFSDACSLTLNIHIYTFFSGHVCRRHPAVAHVSCACYPACTTTRLETLL